MQRFRRKQSEVEAVQFVDGQYGQAIEFCPKLDVQFHFVGEQGQQATRSVRHAGIGQTDVSDSDWIVKHADGTFEVLEDEDFRAEFEAP